MLKSHEIAMDLMEHDFPLPNTRLDHLDGPMTCHQVCGNVMH